MILAETSLCELCLHTCRVTLVEIKDLPLVMRARSDVLVTATLYHGANKLSTINQPWKEVSII